jgi:hypothetical protein
VIDSRDLFICVQHCAAVAVAAAGELQINNLHRKPISATWFIGSDVVICSRCVRLARHTPQVRLYTFVPRPSTFLLATVELLSQWNNSIRRFISERSVGEKSFLVAVLFVPFFRRSTASYVTGRVDEDDRGRPARLTHVDIINQRQYAAPHLLARDSATSCQHGRYHSVNKNPGMSVGGNLQAPTFIRLSADPETHMAMQTRADCFKGVA